MISLTVPGFSKKKNISCDTVLYSVMGLFEAP